MWLSLKVADNLFCYYMVYVKKSMKNKLYNWIIHVSLSKKFIFPSQLTGLSTQLWFKEKQGTMDVQISHVQV